MPKTRVSRMYLVEQCNGENRSEEFRQTFKCQGTQKMSSVLAIVRVLNDDYLKKKKTKSANYSIN